MNYEDAVKAKHDFQDSFELMLSYVSAMEYRELELAVAKIADAISSGDEIVDPGSVRITGEIIKIVLDLRNRGAVKENKLKRLWMARKKKTFAERIATRIQAPAYEKYQYACKQIESIRDLEGKKYSNILKNWQDSVNSLSPLKRLFKAPPRPQRPNWTPYPERPESPFDVKRRILFENSFGQILIQLVVTHSYPYPEYSESFVSERNVKDTSVRLLEAK